MLITDSYLGNRFNGQQIASDAYDDFLKKKGGAAARAAGAPPTKRQQKKAVKAQKKELKKQGLAPKRPGLFGKKKAAATGMNSPAAKKTGLFGIKKKPNSILAKLKSPVAPAPAPMDAPEASSELNEAETPLPDNQAEALADGASSDLGEISDKTPNAEAENQGEPEGSNQGEPLPEPGSEEEQFYSYDLERWAGGRRRRSTSFDSFDEPKESEKKGSENKKKGISVGAVFGLLGAVAAGAIAMYVVMSAGEKTGEPELKLTRTY